MGYSGGGSKSPTAIDLAVALALLFVAVGYLWLPSLATFQQGNKTVTSQEQHSLPAVTIEIVLDTPPTQVVTINNYHAVYQYHDGEGYHLVFVVPANKTYVLSPSCCSRTRYLSPKKYYAYWVGGGCVAIRTDK